MMILRFGYLPSGVPISRNRNEKGAQWRRLLGVATRCVSISLRYPTWLCKDPPQMFIGIWMAILVNSRGLLSIARITQVKHGDWLTCSLLVE